MLVFILLLFCLAPLQTRDRDQRQSLGAAAIRQREEEHDNGRRAPGFPVAVVHPEP
jgi:hypothetical protein